MSNSLTADDVAKLTAYAAAGDRFDYWTLIASKGDRYGSLALGVVTGAEMAGAIANGYAASYAANGSALSDSSSTIAWWTVGLGIMNADLTDRKTDGNAITLSFREVQLYHAAVFTQNGLDVKAWTPYLPFSKYIQQMDAAGVGNSPAKTAANAAAENHWDQMFQQYGMLDGNVAQVWPDASDATSSRNDAGDQGSREGDGISGGFKALVKLSSQTLHSRDHDLPLVPGMKVIVEINQGRQTVMQYLLSPILKVAQEGGHER